MFGPVVEKFEHENLDYSTLYSSNCDFVDSHNAEKLKGEPLGFFNIHSVAKHQKIEERKICIFRKKSHNAEKN